MGVFISMRGKKKNYKNEKILIGKTLKDIRKSLGFTQEYVSEELGLAPRYISDIERDKTKGSIDTLVKLCNLYHVTPTYVLQRYLTTADTKINNNNKINGFEQLSKHDKDFINDLVEFINQKKAKKQKRKASKNSNYSTNSVIQENLKNNENNK